jgi:hypothetical protein
MTYVRVPVPRMPAGLGTNLLGVAGLVAIVFAIGSLTSWKWALLIAGLFAVGLTVIAQKQEAQVSPAGANVTAMGPVRQSRMAAVAEQVTSEFPKVDAG